MAKSQFERNEYVRFDEKESLKWQLLKRKTELWWGGNLSKNKIVKVELIGTLEVYANPKFIAYYGGEVTVTYGGPCLITYSNGYSVKETIFIDKIIPIPSRDKDKEGNQKYENKPLSGAFNGTTVDKRGIEWIFGEVKWSGVTQMGLLKPSLKINMKDEYYDTDSISLNASCEVISINDVVWTYKVNPDDIIDGEDAFVIDSATRILHTDKHFVGYMTVYAKATDCEDSKRIFINCNERIVDPRTHVYTIENVEEPTVAYDVTSVLVHYDCKDSFKYFNGDSDSSSFTASITATFEANTGRTKVDHTGYTDAYENAKVKKYTVHQGFNPKGIKEDSYRYEIKNVNPNPIKIEYNELTGQCTYDTIDHFQYFDDTWGETKVEGNKYTTSSITQPNSSETAKTYTEYISYKTAPQAKVEIIQDFNHDGIKSNSYKYEILNVLPNPAEVDWDVTTTSFTYNVKETFEYFDERTGSTMYTGLTFTTSDFGKNTSDENKNITQTIKYKGTHGEAQRDADICQRFNPYGVYLDSHKYSIENIQPQTPATIDAADTAQTFTYDCVDKFQYFNKEWDSNTIPTSHTITFETANTSDHDIDKTDTVTYETASAVLKVIQKYDTNNNIVRYEGKISDIINPSDVKWNDTTATVKFTGKIYSVAESGQRKKIHEYTTLTYTVNLKTNDSDTPQPYTGSFEWNVLQTIEDKKIPDIDTSKEIKNDSGDYNFTQEYNPAKKLVSYRCFGEQIDASTTEVVWNASSVDIKYYGYCEFTFEEGKTVVKSKNPLKYTYFIPQSEWNDSGSEVTISNKQFKWEVTVITSDDFSSESGAYFPSSHSVDEGHQPYVAYSFKQGYNPDKVVSYYSYEIINVVDPNADYTKQTVQIEYVGEVTEHYESGNKKKIAPQISKSQPHSLEENITSAEKPYDVTVSWDIRELQTKTYIDKDTSQTQSSPVTKDDSFNQGYNKDNKVKETIFELTQCDTSGQKADEIVIAYNEHNAYIPYSCKVTFVTEGNPKEYTVVITGENQGHYWSNIFTTDNTTTEPRNTASTRPLRPTEKQTLLTAIITEIDKDSASNKDIFQTAIQDSKFSPTTKIINLDCKVTQGIGDIYLYYGQSQTPTVKAGTTLSTETIGSLNNLSKVVLGGNVTSVQKELFKNHGTLQEFDAHLSNVTIIDDSTFESCTGLTTIGLPPQIESINDSAFKGCTSLTSVIIPNTVTNVGSSCFANCTSLTSATLSTNEGYTTLKEKTFYKCTSLTGLSIPVNIETIEQEACFGDTKLSVLTLTDGIVSIGNSAFTNCFSDTSIKTKTQSVVLPNTVESVGEYAFANCTYLNGVTLSTGMTMVERYTFANCNGGGVSTYSATGNSLSTLTVPSNIQSIKECAFSGAMHLNNITFESGLQQIGPSAFTYCYQITGATQLVIPDTVTDMGEKDNMYNYIYKSSQTSVWYYRSVSDDKTVNGYSYCAYKDSANNIIYTWGEVTYQTYSYYTYDGDKMTIHSDDILYPSSSVSAEGYAFSYCTYLPSVRLSNQVTIIPQNTFEYCTNMTYCNLRADDNGQIQQIHKQAFQYCYNLNNVVFPYTTEELHKQAFYYCRSLSSINITSNIKRIGDGSACGDYTEVFSYCYSLNTVTVDDANEVYYNEVDKDDKSFNCCLYRNNKTGCVCFGGNNPTLPTNGNSLDIGPYAFEGNIYLDSKTITIPNCFSVINRYAFYDCDGIRTLSINTTASTLQTIGDYAFANCDYLNELTTPNSLQTIGDCAFYDCDNLSMLQLNENLKTINTEAFENCKSLTSITIPDSVTSIGVEAFYNCIKAQFITLLGRDLTSIGKRAFAYTPSVTSITVTHQPTYSSTGNCCMKGEELVFGCQNSVIPSNCTQIQEYAFCGCNTLKSITIPNSVTTIGTNIFYYCTGLTSVTISNSITHLSDSTFNYCSSLKSVTIPDSVTSIGTNVFYHCTGLTSVTISNNLTTINTSVFYNCTNLISIIIPESVQNIYSQAFYNCSKLKEITCLNSTPPSIASSSFYGVVKNGILYVNNPSDYQNSKWMSADSSYLGYYNWTVQSRS